MPAGIYLRPSTRDRFEKFCEKIPEAGCWIWTGGVLNSGYGAIMVNKKNYLAHRLSYELFVNRIPNAMQVLHSCDVKTCVNPGHLFLGSQQQNMADMIKKGRQIARGGPFPSGEKCYCHKLSQLDVLAILEDKRLQKVIAKEYGVIRQTISQIKLRKTWKHIT